MSPQALNLLSEPKYAPGLQTWVIVSCVLALLFGLFLASTVGLGWLMPWWVSIPIFYWSLRQPDKLPFAVPFLIGLMQDVFVGTPLGFHSLGLIFLAWLTSRQGMYLKGRVFVVVWVAFVLNLLASLCVMMILTVLMKAVFSYWALAMLLMTTLMLPPFFMVLTWSHRKFRID